MMRPFFTFISCFLSTKSKLSSDQPNQGSDDHAAGLYQGALHRGKAVVELAESGVHAAKTFIYLPFNLIEPLIDLQEPLIKAPVVPFRHPCLLLCDRCLHV